MKIDSFLRKLWSINSESNWAQEDILSDSSGLRHFQDYLENVLSLFNDYLPNITHAFVAVAGVDTGLFKPIASINRNLNSIKLTPTWGGGTLVSKFIHNKDQVVLIQNPSSHPEYTGDKLIKEKCILKLIGNGEFFGFISLDSNRKGVFNKHIIDDIKEIQPYVSRVISDAFFTYILRCLSSRYEYDAGEQDLAQVYQEIVRRTILGFSADGAVIRLYNPTYDLLAVEASDGTMSSMLTGDREVGEGICGSLFAKRGAKWVIWTKGQKPKSNNDAFEISDSDMQRLLEDEINSFAIIKLTSEVPSFDGTQNLGTLSFFHRRSHNFSWRDIALLTSHSQRIADMIALRQKAISLQESAENILLQSRHMTRVEIVALLAHDLGHKAFAACYGVDELIKTGGKAINKPNEKKLVNSFHTYADKAKDSVLSIQESIQQIRLLSANEMSEFDKVSEFNFSDVLNQVESTMRGALDRNKITIRNQSIKDYKILGYKSVLSQALFNLTINSIEALRSRRTTRPSVIHINTTKQKQMNDDRLIIHFWDDGPGINRAAFNNPNEIFELGKTTKDQGTGTGLPVTRNLLTRYFLGSLDLEDANVARFRITIPIRSRRT